MDLQVLGDVQMLIPFERTPGGEIEELLRNTSPFVLSVLKEKAVWLETVSLRTGPKEIVDHHDVIVYLITAANRLGGGEGRGRRAEYPRPSQG